MRGRKCILLLLLSILLCACNGKEEGVTYDLYFPTKTAAFGEPTLIAEPCRLEEGEEVIPQLLKLLLKGPEGEGASSIIPHRVRVRDWTLKDGVLTVDFTSPYGLLSGIDLTLADYSVTITLSQVPGVSSVVTTVEGDPITYRDYPKLRAEDVLLGIYRNEPERRLLTLYFPQKDGKGLGQEERSILVPEDQSLVMTLLEAFSQGPQEEGLAAILSEGEILSAEVKDGQCILNLSGSFEEAAAMNPSKDRLVIDALVKTLCQLDHVSAVSFLSEGEGLARYGTVELQGPVYG